MKRGGECVGERWRGLLGEMESVLVRDEKGAVERWREWWGEVESVGESWRWWCWAVC